MVAKSEGEKRANPNETSLQRFGRELLLRKEKGDLVIAGSVTLASDGSITLYISPSQPIYDFDRFHKFVLGLSPFRDRDHSFWDGMTDRVSFEDIIGKSTITVVNNLDPLSEDSARELGVKTVGPGNSVKTSDIYRRTEVIVFPHPKIAQIAFEQARQGEATRLSVGNLDGNVLKKVHESEKHGRPFPAELFLPVHVGR